jgi:large subunit ribosomal protein L21
MCPRFPIFAAHAGCYRVRRDAVQSLARDRIVVNRLPHPEGSEFTLSEVLLLEKDGQVQVGRPTVSYPVTVKVLQHLRGPKIRVFKKKRRKGYEKRIGHRQALSLIEIQFS